MASPLTVWSTAADGTVSAFDSTWALSRAGTGTLSFDDAYTSIPFASRYVNSSDRYYSEQAFFDFDTSTVGASSTVTAATLSLYGKTASILTSYVIDCFASNWGGTLGTGDFVPGATLEGLTLLANYNLDGGWPTDAYTGFTSTADFLSSIDQAGTTYLVLVSDWQVTNTTPLNNSYAAAYAAEDATGGGGTDRDPKLYVEYTEGGSALTVWSTTADGYIDSGSGASYADARDGTGGVLDVYSSAASVSVGQAPGDDCWEAFFDFDTSSVGAGSTVTVATISLYGSSDASTTDFNLRVRAKDWSGGGLTTADWVAGAALTGNTLVAHYDTANGWPTNAYTALADDALPANIAKTATTYVMCHSDRQEGSGNDPSSNELVRAYSANDATGGGGTDRDPKLYVEYTEGGSVLTAWSSAADGYMWGYSTTYATARSTVIGASVVTTDSYSYVGQLFTGANFQCWEAFESFDTSSVDDDGTMTSATLSLYNSYDNTSTDFTVEARIKDWGATLTSADWVSGNPADTPSIDDYTLVASKSTTPTWPTDAYTALTSDAAFLTSIAKTGTTYIMLSSDRQLSGTEPTGNEWLAPYSAEDATGGGGTDRDPKLYVEWTEGGDAPTLTTNTVTDITSSTATSGGSITGIGGSAITDYGLCWSKTNPPTITDAHTHDKP